jgi:hypothetical protein
MNTRLLRLSPIATAPRYLRRKRARFFSHIFYTPSVFSMIFMFGILFGIALTKLLTYWDI